MLADLLKRVGLSDGEILVYEILLDKGRQPVTRIHEQAGIERRNIYDILTKLINKGLVSFITENRTRIFQAANPKQLLHYLDEKTASINSVRKEVEQHAEELLLRYSSTKPSYDAQIFRGADGIKAARDDQLNAKEILWIGSGSYFPRQFPHFYARWARERIKRGIIERHLYRAEFRGKLDANIDLGDKGEIRYLPEQFSGNPAAICIWGSNVGNFMLDDDYFAFVITSDPLAQNYRNYFEYIWNNVAIMQ